MKPERTWKDLLGITGKGMLMGAADAIPGVSGGTIAFITGIYEELIHSLKQFGPEFISLVLKAKIIDAWKHINGTFLLALFSGILLSVISVSHIVLSWLEHYPELLWSFFFGLILAAVWSLIKHVDKWRMSLVISFVGGALAAYLITELPPSQVSTNLYWVFFAGMIAICAMILPGISGSFLLVLLGMYTYILEAVKSFDLSILLVFAGGCATGLLSFSRVLNWMFERHKETTLTLLGGFMLGSLNKVWPWKITIESTLDSHGKLIPLVQSNILPTEYSLHFFYALGLMALGIALVLITDKVGDNNIE